MVKTSNVSRDLEERNEEGRNVRTNREGAHSKTARREGGREIRSRGEGSNGGRRRERKSKDSSSGYITTPTPDHLPKSFYQTPVILERRPQATVPINSQIAGKSVEANSKQITNQMTPKINNDESVNAISSINIPRVETKQSTPQGTLRGKSSDRPFVKMINEKGIFNQEPVLKILSELPGHFVVGVCGPQGTGKSTVVSAFCQDPQNAFSIQSIDALVFASHETTGIDIHVTPERIIILDTQPLFSLSVLEHAIRNDYIPDNMSPELWLESQSLQVIVFLYSVCNVVITVTEGVDHSMWNFLKKAEMLKYRIPEFPTVPSLMSADAGAEYYPDIDSISMSKSFTMYEHVSDRSLPNLFLLPYEGQPLRSKPEGIGLNYLNAPDTFLVMAESLRNQIFQLPKKTGKKGQVSEKEWFRSSMKTWDIVRKSEFLSEYGKLSQKTKEM